MSVRKTGKGPIVPHSVDPNKFREVLGHYPTGVAVITGIADDAEAIAMVVGTFTSVSLEPPLIAFLPTKSSFTFERLRTAGSFAVNILAHDQEELCRVLARPARDKLANLPWAPSAGGAPVFEGVVASIECRPFAELDGGDHYIVLGEVTDLQVHRPVVPLLFFQGGYGGFTPRSLMVPTERDLASAVTLAHEVRSDMELLAEALCAEVTAFARVGDDVAAVATVTGDGVESTAVLGSRFPLMAPMGELFVAWRDDEIERWLHRDRGLDDAMKQFYLDRLARTRENGWACTLAQVDDEGRDPIAEAVRLYNDPERTPARERAVNETLRNAASRYRPIDLARTVRYDVGAVASPVHNADGEVQLVLRLSQLPRDVPGSEVEFWARQLIRAANDASRRFAAA